MQWPGASIVRKFREFAKDPRGVAVVEFALILPALLVLYLGSIEASSLITVDRRVNIISGTVGDLVARWDPDNGAFDLATLTDYFRASEVIIQPYSTTGLQQVVSVISVDADGLATVEWSCAYNGGTKHAEDSEYSSLPENVNLLARGGTVVASETSYAYEPLLGIVLSDTYNLHSASYYLPRFEELIDGPAC